MKSGEIRLNKDSKEFVFSKEVPKNMVLELKEFVKRLQKEIKD